jgi:tetratricopeptide (TPR) repeat protein
MTRIKLLGAVGAALVLAFLTLTCPARAAEQETGASRIDELKMKAMEHFSAQDYDKAIPLLRQVLEIDPRDKMASRYLLIVRRQIVEPFCKKAADAYVTGDYQKAVSFWERILEIDPEDRRVQRLIDETFIATDEEATESMFRLANSLLQEGRYDEARNELTKIIEIDPENDRAQELLTSVSRTLTDTNIKGHYDRAEAHRAEGRFDLAIKEWGQVLEIDPNQDLASRLIASVQKTQLDEQYGQAEASYIAGDYLQAREAYQRILDSNPTDQSLKRLIENLSATIAVVPQVRDEGKVWDIVRKGLSHHISRTGNPKVAIASLWYASQLQGESAVIMAIRDYIEREYASDLRSMEPPVKDMNLVDQYLFAALNNIYEGRYDLAIQLCSLVSEIEPQNVLALKRMGSAYYAMGRKDKARAAWQRAQKLTPNDQELNQFIKQLK